MELAFYYAGHLSTYVLPLLTVVYVARVLGPEYWGVLAFFHSFGMYASQVIEYGFNLGGTRDIARKKDDAEGRAAVLRDVTTAKLLLAGGLIPVAGLAYVLAPLCSRWPLYFASAFLYAVAQGFGMMWYFQGLGELKRIVSVEVVSRTVVSLLIIVVVSKPEDGWLMILLNALSCLITIAGGCWLARADLRSFQPDWVAGWRTLRAGFPLFVFRGGSSLYGSANGFLLGLVAPVSAVGLYSGAERVQRGFVALAHPLTQFLFARTNRAFAPDSPEAAKVARQSMFALILNGIGLGAICWFGAPLLVRILLGPGYAESAAALRVFALTIVADSTGAALGMQWMLPLGMDKQFTAVVLAGGLLNLCLVPVLGPRFGHVGMAWAVLACHSFVALGCYSALRRKGIDPIGAVRMSPAAA